MTKFKVGDKIKVKGFPRVREVTIIFQTKSGETWIGYSAGGAGLPNWEREEWLALVERPPVVPKMWRDLSPEEKGALLLAYHEGKTIEWKSVGFNWVSGGGCIPIWADHIVYSVKSEPKIVTVDLMADFKAIGTINLVDGVPDFNSIKKDET